MKLMITVIGLFLLFSVEGSSKVNKISDRSKDWRNNQVIYQIFVDRFANGDSKNDHNIYKKPRTIEKWSTSPKPGKYLPKIGYWSHELQFWGGDLTGVIKKFDYIKGLGINTIYFNPLFYSYTNHKYDTIDYFKIDPGFGTIEDLKKLTDLAHKNGIKVVIDGVFNHMGMHADWFKSALKSKKSSYRPFFKFDKSYKNGYNAWFDIKNLPELQLENKAVSNRIISSPNSVVRKYLKIVDGWRLDVANNIGPKILNKITSASHKEKKDSLVVGEAWNYPDGWLKSMDGVMNFYLRELILNTIKQKISTSKFNFLVNKMILDCGIESILKSWNVLSNHDTPRLINLLPLKKDRQMATLLQYTLPGSPVLYYGEEIGMKGEEDPENRGPMEWHKIERKSESFILKMVKLRQQMPALQYGDYVQIYSDNFIAYARKTDKISDFVIILVNVGRSEHEEILSIPEYKLMNRHYLKNMFGAKKVVVSSGTIKVKLKAKEAMMLVPVMPKSGFSSYKRVE